MMAGTVAARSLLCAAWMVAARHVGAQGVVRDTIIGEVRRAVGKPIAGAAVFVTRAPDMQTYNTTTDSLGRFRFAEIAGTGEYLVSVSAPGFKPVRMRAVRSPGAHLVRVKAVLQPFAQAMQNVVVTARHEAPEPASGLDVGTGASEGLADGAMAALPPLVDRVTDLARTSLAGISRPEGWSVAGLSASQTTTQLNGLTFGGGVLPRTLPLRARLVASSYDIAEAGFSGGLIALEVPAAGEFRTATGQLTGGTSVSEQIRSTGALGQDAFGNAVVDIGGSWRNRRGTQGLTAGARLVAEDVLRPSLEDATDSTLAALGAPPNLARLANALVSSRLGAYAPHPARTRLEFTSLMRYDLQIREKQTNAFLLSVRASTEPQSRGTPLASASLGARRTGVNVTAQWHRAWIANERARWEWRSGIAVSADDMSPAVGGRALVTVVARATSGDSASGPTLSLGGLSGPEHDRRVIVESRLQRDAYAGAKSTHLVRSIFSVRLDENERAMPSVSSVLGFRSIDDLAAARPDVVSTVVGAASGRADAASVRIGIGDEWRALPRLSLQAGALLDVFALRRPMPSWTLGTSAGANEWGRVLATLSPRFGLSWQFVEPTEGVGYRTSNLFQRHLVPSGMLRVGAGLFQRDAQPEASLQRQGTWGPQQVGWCDARVVRSQEWPGMTLDPGAISRACADGTVGGSTQLRRDVVDPSFRPPVSARATANLLLRVRNVDMELSALVNETRLEPGERDRAISSVAFTSFGTEDARLFFSPLGAIDARTGLVRPDLASTDPRVRNDVLLTSDGRTRSQQLSLQISPVTSDTRAVLRAGYVWTRARSRQNGWERDAFGDPSRPEWGPSPGDVQHQFQLETGWSEREVSVILWTRAFSGTPFTPLVDGDVNGDGNSWNDRAYLPLFSHGEITPLSAAVAHLARTAPDRVASCLTANEGRAVPRGACRGPWSMTSGLMINADTRLLGMGDGTLSLAIDNLGALADVLVHGRNLVGWGGSGQVDPVLLRVIGFDPQRQAFRYAVNSGFGRAPVGSGFAGGAGYRVTLTLSIPLAPPIAQQQVERWLRARGVGERLPAETLARRFARNVPSLYEDLFASAETLLLQPEQIEILTHAREPFERALMGVWTRLAQKLLALGPDFDMRSTVQAVDTATDEAWEVSRLEAHKLRSVLTPIQERLLPWPASVLIRAEQPVHFRITYY